MKKRIVFITDCTDVAYSELRATVFNILGDVENIEIEPVVSVKPFSLINGSFILRLMGEVYPPGTIFSVILNPAQNRPKRIVGRTKNKDFLFVGTDTGVFEWFFKDFGISEIYELKNLGFFPFGGKYVHAPAVAQLAAGKPLNEMGDYLEITQLKNLNLKKHTILHIDNFGLMKLNLTIEDIGDGSAKEGDKFLLKIKDISLECTFSHRMMSNQTGSWIIYPGSSMGLVEVGMVRRDGARELGVEVGDIFVIMQIS